jgi:PPOX class probable FMN-dependent enzyme
MGRRRAADPPYKDTAMASPHRITTLDALRALYGPARERSVRKELPHLDPHAIRFIGLSPWVVVASSGPASEGGALDASPRGGDPGFVKVLDHTTLLLPDAPGNNRLDTLENIVQTGRLGLLFCVPGIDETLRVNGTAVLSTQDTELALCADTRRVPKLVIRVTVQAAYLHCAKALMRSALWDATRHVPRSIMPSMGEMMRDQIGSDLPAETQSEMLVRYASSL